MGRDPISSHFFSVVVVQHDGKFLIVQEARRNQAWYLPAGRVEAGESFADAAKRETLEEGGVAVAIDGVLRVEHTPLTDGTRVRAIFLARPAGDAAPKQTADDHSLQAAWVTLDELDNYPLRGIEVFDILQYVANGGKAHPASLIQREGEAWAVAGAVNR